MMLAKSLIIILFSSTILLAQTNIQFEGIGGKIGFIMPENPIDNTISISAHAELGNINNQFFLGGFLEYWTKSYKTGIAGFDGRWSEFIIAPYAKYIFNINSTISPYAGAGIGFAIVSYKNDFDRLGQRVTDSSSKLDVALFGFGGFEFPVNQNLKGLVELKFHVDGANFLGLYAGMTYMLPTGD